MAYAQIRVKSLDTGSISATDIHNARKYEDIGLPVPANINSEFSRQNSYRYFDEDNESELSLKQLINKREKDMNVKAIRKNSIHAIELVVSVSDKQFFEGDKKANIGGYSPEGFASVVQQEFLNKMLGSTNVIARYIHHDESKPHVHFVVTPIIEKKVHWKNQRSEGTRIENRLDAQNFIGGKEKLRELQQSFYEFCKQRFQNYAEFYRGIKAEEQKKEYIQRVNYKLGQYRAKLASLTNENEKKILIADLNKNQAEIEKELSKFDAGIEKVIEDRKRHTYDWKNNFHVTEWGEQVKPLKR
jgi:hypothetical protein